MRALTIEPGRAQSLALEELAAPERSASPQRSASALLVRALAVGVCGTDHELVQGLYGAAPPGRKRLVIGHESLGEVLEAGPESGFTPGDRVVGIVRRPDPVPCISCAAGEWDMCLNGEYTECGIKQLDGFAAERFVLSPAFAVRLDPALGLSAVLLEPASVIAKAWQHIEHIGGRVASFRPRTVLVTGAGPVGLLAALMGVQRGLEVHVFDRVTSGPKPELVRDLGAVYHTGARVPVRPDVVLECTGARGVIRDVIENTRPGGIVCLTGISSAGPTTAIDLGRLNRTMVLENDVVFGSVNANRGHYELAARALASADPAWLSRLITRRVPLERYAEALRNGPADVKVVIDFTL